MRRRHPSPASRLGPAALGLGLLVTAGGCSASLRSISSSEVGCPADRIEIRDERLRLSGEKTWTAVCGDQLYYCSGIEGTAISSPMRETECTAATTSGVRRVAGASGAPRLELSVPASRFMLHLASEPTRFPDRIAVVLETRQPAGTHTDCQVRVMIDGTVVEGEPTRYELHEDGEYLRTRWTPALLERMVGAERVSGRVCDEEWRLGDDARQSLRELLARLAEERQWAGAADRP